MTELGEYALWIALPIAIWGATLAWVARKTGRRALVTSAERSVHVVFALVLIAACGLLAALFGARYEYAYVFEHADPDLPARFAVAALWAGIAGMLLFQTLALALFSSVFVGVERREQKELIPGTIGILLAIVAVHLVVILVVASPFERLPFAPTEGRGLHPRLVSDWLILHPSLLIAGGAALVVPLAFAVAGLLDRGLDPGRAAVVRRWMLVGWILLSAGILAGMRRAHEVTGWAGFGSWDLGDLAWLLPWLLSAVTIHWVPVPERRIGERIAYAGILIFAIGCVGLTLSREVSESVEPGDTIAVQSRFGSEYLLRYEGLSTAVEADRAQRWIATVSLHRDGRSIEFLNTEHRLHFREWELIIEPAIRSSFLEEMHIVLDELDEHVGAGTDPDHHRITLRILVHPFLSWIWYGGLVMILGGIVALMSGGGAGPAGGSGGRVGDRSAGVRSGETHPERAHPERVHPEGTAR